jgi:NCS1 family nucleobase:cation symporter-1
MALQDQKMGSGSDTYSQAEVGSSGPIKRSRFSLAVDQEPSSFAATPNASNADFDPIPPSKRTWGTGAYVAYWMADAWAVSNWEVASSMIAAGLSWRMAIGACVLGNTIMGLVITMNGRIGAKVSLSLFRHYRILKLMF